MYKRLLLSSVSVITALLAIAAPRSLAEPSSYSIWSDSTPLNAVVDKDTKPVELGLKFRSDVDGEVSAIRFYRAVANESGYFVHLWSSTGELLGTGMAFEGQQPAPGWQTVQFYPPIPVKAKQIYIASYYVNSGRYVASEKFFENAGVDNGFLHALRNGEAGSNSTYIYGYGGGFPTQSYNSTNYWIDVVFKPKTTSIWNDSVAPSSIATFDSRAIEVGVKFKATKEGFVTGIRFYKAATNTGTHVGSLWTAGGQLIARGTFVSETTSGWQQLKFDQPIRISADAIYVASYHAPKGNYAYTLNHFASPMSNSGLQFLDGNNGVYKYGNSSFPSQTYKSSNYWVDVLYTPIVD
ncbi:hypothetical protein C7Y66_15955 [Chroococcidiopsis sp. CCALA 051]|uniref:DUF4082 domain-containing protein n=1 Tax=Chroococcidiopsis sp. CCALA 051 TaxID=869949 RepID=UPI000D0D93BE|nr:DUF4082 domain-containing protein [Chroococcidiopsis sp. CCALA 051]PSM48159.1 hypothetical protein C7Y66_15955 [Chroococcidiopsis sp. CCALA 051]